MENTSLILKLNVFKLLEISLMVRTRFIFHMNYFPESFHSQDDTTTDQIDVTSLDDNDNSYVVEQAPQVRPPLAHEYANQDDVITGLPSLEEDVINFDGGEVVQEEIVGGVEETDIVSWDAVMADSIDDFPSAVAVEQEVTSQSALHHQSEEPQPSLFSPGILYIRLMIR